jgi:hypothetical protein
MSCAYGSGIALKRSHAPTTKSTAALPKNK